MHKILRAAVIGVGFLGRFHAQKLAAAEGVELVAVVDTDPGRAEEVAAESGTLALTDYRQILDRVDLVTIAVPTRCHFAIARDFLAAGRHVLLEKPITENIFEADELIRLAALNKVVFQAGHLERFNPAIMAMQGVVKDPRIVFSHRLAPYKLRGTDVSVVLDLMIHDIDILLQTIPSRISNLRSVGVVGPSGQPDIVNARLQFENGCIANVTASRVSSESRRQFRVFGVDQVASVDCQARRLAVLSRDNTAASGVAMEEKSFAQGDPLREEIEAFVTAVREGTPPLVSGEDGRRALEVALQIDSRLESLSP